MRCWTHYPPFPDLFFPISRLKGLVEDNFKESSTDLKLKESDNNLIWDQIYTIHIYNDPEYKSTECVLFKISHYICDDMDGS